MRCASRHDAGRRSAFDAAVTPHLDCLRRAARRVLRDDEAAEDAVQNALLRLWSRSATFYDEFGNDLPPPRLRAVLMSWLVPESLQMRRAARRRRHYEDAAESSPTGGCGDPACEAGTREFVEQLDRAIGNLPGLEREVVSLRRDGIELREIATRLAVPLGTVKSTLHRARRRLAAVDVDLENVYQQVSLCRALREAS